jgi:hypothetical protein
MMRVPRQGKCDCEYKRWCPGHYFVPATKPKNLDVLKDLSKVKKTHQRAKYVAADTGAEEERKIGRLSKKQKEWGELVSVRVRAVLSLSSLVSLLSRVRAARVRVAFLRQVCSLLNACPRFCLVG